MAQTIGDYIEELEIHAGNSAAYSKYIENFYNASNAEDYIKDVVNTAFDTSKAKSYFQGLKQAQKDFKLNSQGLQVWDRMQQEHAALYESFEDPKYTTDEIQKSKDF